METPPTLQDLLDTWLTWSRDETLRRITEPGTPGDADQALAALAASRRLQRQLAGFEWQAVRDARECGATWEDVGEAMGISRQGAHEMYARAVEQQVRQVQA